MLTVYRHSLGRSIGQILGWGIALALIGAYGMLLYDTLVKPQAQQQFEQLVSTYPPALMTFFGDMTKMFTPGGYIDTLFFAYIPIVIGMYGIIAGGGLLAGDEEKGILDLVLAYPVRRSKLFFGRLGAFITVILSILVISWLGFIIPLPKTSFSASIWELLLPFLSLFSMLIFFGTLTILLSLLLPSQQWSTMISGLFLVVSYFLTSFARLSEDLRPIEKFFPMHYYQGGMALADMNWGWFGLLIGFSIVFTGLALWSFERRDIRVSGEAGWGLAGLMGRKIVKEG